MSWNPHTELGHRLDAALLIVGDMVAGARTQMTAEEVAILARDLRRSALRRLKWHTERGRGRGRLVELRPVRGRKPSGYRANRREPVRIPITRESVLELEAAATYILRELCESGIAVRPRRLLRQITSASGSPVAILVAEGSWVRALVLAFQRLRAALESRDQTATVYHEMARAWATLPVKYRLGAVMAVLDHYGIDDERTHVYLPLARRWLGLLAGVSPKRVKDLASEARRDIKRQEYDRLAAELRDFRHLLGYRENLAALEAFVGHPIMWKESRCRHWIAIPYSGDDADYDPELDLSADAVPGAPKIHADPRCHARAAG